MVAPDEMRQLMSEDALQLIVVERIDDLLGQHDCGAARLRPQHRRDRFVGDHEAGLGLTAEYPRDRLQRIGCPARLADVSSQQPANANELANRHQHKDR